MSLPKLRFSEFIKDWKAENIDDLFDIITDYVAAGSFANIKENVNYLSKPDFAQLVRTIDVKNNFRNKDSIFVDKNAFNFLWRVNLNENSIILPNIGANIGEIYFIDSNKLPYEKNVLGPNSILLKTNNNILFKYHLLCTAKFNKELKIISESSGQPKFNKTSLKKIKLNIPSFDEQEKIASFLSKVDEKIGKLEEKKELWKNYKKGIMQQIFSQKLRFKDENREDYPDWEEKKLNELVTRITRKNKNLESDLPLTISAQHGLIDQISFFNKIVASKSLKGYYLIKKGEFAYNKSYSSGFPWGVIKRLDKYEQGALSTLYICFSLKKDVNSDFFVQYFSSNNWYREVYNIAVEGARNHGLLNISVIDFFNTSHIIPTLNEQIKIANFLTAIDIKIEELGKELELNKEFKKGLLQQMFC